MNMNQEVRDCINKEIKSIGVAKDEAEIKKSFILISKWLKHSVSGAQYKEWVSLRNETNKIKRYILFENKIPICIHTIPLKLQINPGFVL